MIVFPRDLPANFANQVSFELQRVDFAAPEAGGRVGGVTAGAPLWRASWSIGTISARKSDEVRAWVASLRGQQRLFLGYDITRPLPRGAMQGSPCTVAPATWSQALAADGTALLTLTGLLPGEVLAWGDYVGFTWDGWKRAMVRTIDYGAASGAGILTIAVEPAVSSVVPATAAATLSRPACLMRLLSDTQLGDVGRRGAVTGGKITAVQDLRA